MRGLALMNVIIISMMIDTKGYVSNWKIFCDVDGPLKAEVDTSVIISCSYTHDDNFTPKAVTWLKCEESMMVCRDSDMIFHSNVNAGLDEFKGRVSILEPDVTTLNVSIVIRDLRVSDTGFYQLRVEGTIKGKFFPRWFTDKRPIEVTGLAQPKISGKTTAKEGDTLHLTCEAQSSPPSTVAWAEVGSRLPLVSGTQRANLVIPNATTDHSGRYSCTAQHLTKTLTSIADVTVWQLNKCSICPIPEKKVEEKEGLFRYPTLVTSIIVTLVIIGVLALLAALMAACICCLNHRYTCRNQAAAVRDQLIMKMVTDQTGGGQGVSRGDGHPGVGESGREREVPLPGPTGPCSPI